MVIIACVTLMGHGKFHLAENSCNNLSDMCGKFCQVVNSCRAYEVSNYTQDSYNCVLFEKLGKTFWDNVPN